MAAERVRQIPVVLEAEPPTAEKKGRELNAPPPKAPPGARAENTPSRARVARAWDGLCTQKTGGFWVRP